MKKGICLLLLTITILFTACSEKSQLVDMQGKDISVGNAVVVPSSTTAVLPSPNTVVIPSANIIVETPMTLSDNPVDFNGAKAILRLRMVNGKYYEDWNPGAIMGTIWEGKFVFELTDELGNVISQTELSEVYSEPLVFTNDFKLEFDDYNNDGCIDFTLGQYATSNGRVYKLFTINPDGSVKELQIKDHKELFISDASGYYSTKLQKTGDKSFSYQYYDNSKGKTFEPVFEWKDGAFVETATKEMG